MTSEELQAELRRRVQYVVGSKRSDRADAARNLVYAKSTISRWCDGSLKVSESAARRLDAYYGPLVDELGWTSFAELQRLVDEAKRRETGGLAWVPPELGGNIVCGPFLDQESAYRAVAEVLRTCDPHDPQDRELVLASLHGHSGVRLEDVRPTAVPERSAALEDFDAALKAMYLAKGRHAWHVRQLFTVPTSSRLNSILERLEAYTDAPGLEVKAYTTSKSLPVIAPLVVGRMETFLGLDDQRIYRICSAVQITGRAVAAWTTSYFDRLWNDAPFTVRSLVGIDQHGVDRLQRVVDRRRRPKPTT